MKNEEVYYQEVFQQMKHLVPEERPQTQTYQQLTIEGLIKQSNKVNEQTKTI